MADLAHIIALQRARADAAGNARDDGWNNLITGLNISGRDKRTGANFQAFAISPTDCEEFYRGDDLAARCVEIPAREMTRKWLDVLVQDDDAGFSKDAQEGIAEEFKRLDVQEQSRESLKWASVFGGTALLVGAADGAEDALEPLDMNKIQSVEWLTLLDARECIAVNWYGDVAAPKYGQPQVYRIQPLTLDLGASSMLASESLSRLELKGLFSDSKRIGKGLVRYVHESRIIRFEGVRLTRRQMRRQRGWGDSVYVRLAEEIRDFQSSFDNIAQLLTDVSQAVYKIKGLAEIIGSAQGSQMFMARLQALDAARSTIRALVMDEGEEFERKGTPLTGIADILDKFMLRLAAAAELPVSLLMGQAPAGLNATGDSDIRFFYDRMSSMQERELTPPLTRLSNILFAAKEGPTRGRLPKKWQIVHRPLWQLDDQQQADVHQKQANADALYIDRQVVTPEEIAKSRFGGAKYSTSTQIDMDSRNLMASSPAGEKIKGPAGKVPAGGPNDKLKPSRPSAKAPDPGESTEAAPAEGQQRKAGR
jgi:phage-related protein (TIGR01555 family)